MQLIGSYVQRMLPFLLCAAPVYALVRFLLLRRHRRLGNATTLWHEAGLFIFILFLTGLYSQAVVPALRFDASGISVPGFLQGRVNLVPFTVFADTWREASEGNTAYFLINFLGNIGMFVPVGFFVPLLWRGQGLGRTALVGFFCSLAIELCQLLLPRGTDVDDLWLNTLGAAAGYGLFWICGRLWPALVARFRMRRRAGEALENELDTK